MVRQPRAMRTLLPCIVASLLAVVATVFAYSARQDAQRANDEVAALRLQLAHRRDEVATLAKRMHDFEAVLAQGTPGNVQADLRALRSSTQEAFNAVGQALATLREDGDKKLPRPADPSR